MRAWVVMAIVFLGMPCASAVRNLAELDADNVANATTGIHVIVAVHRGMGVYDNKNHRQFNLGQSNARYAYRTLEEPKEPKPAKKEEPPLWMSMPIGCDALFNTGLCQVVLYQSACEKKHGAESGRKVEDACRKLWPRGDKEPRYLYCLAAAADPALQGSAEAISDGAPAKPQNCGVDTLDHLKSSVPGNRKSDQHHDSVARVRHEDAQKSLIMYNNGVTRDFRNQVVSECTRLTTLSQGLSSGYCHADNAAGQDCELLAGIRAGWGTKYGASFCASLSGPGVLRCQALRRQLVEVAEAKSNFIVKTAYFTKFDELAKISRHSCPAQGFPAAENVGEVTEAEIVDEDE